MSEQRLEDVADLADLVHQVREGEVIYLTEHGERLAAIVPSSLAAELASLSAQDRAELFEDLADALAARRALESIAAGEPVFDWNEVKARQSL